MCPGTSGLHQIPWSYLRVDTACSPAVKLCPNGRSCFMSPLNVATTVACVYVHECVHRGNGCGNSHISSLSEPGFLSVCVVRKGCLISVSMKINVQPLFLLGVTPRIDTPRPMGGIEEVTYYIPPIRHIYK